jgi:hypothetical protein
MKLYFGPRSIPELSHLPYEVARQVYGQCLRRHALRDAFFYKGIALAILIGCFAFFASPVLFRELRFRENEIEAFRLLCSVYAFFVVYYPLIHSLNKRYRPLYAAAARGPLPSPKPHLRFSQLEIRRRDLVYLFALSVLFPLIGVGVLYVGGLHYLYPILCGGYLLGGGTAYGLICWRDSRWWRTARLFVIHCFNTLSMFLLPLLLRAMNMLGHHFRR